MGTSAEKLNYLAETKEAIKDAIINKGAEVSDMDTFRSYAEKIDELPTMYVAEELPSAAKDGDWCLLLG